MTRLSARGRRQFLSNRGRRATPHHTALAAALARPEVDALWAAANEQAHALLLAVLSQTAAAGSLGTEGDGQALELNLTPIGDLIATDSGSSRFARSDRARGRDRKRARGSSRCRRPVRRGRDRHPDRRAVSTRSPSRSLRPAGGALATGAIGGSLVVIGALTLLVRSASADAALTSSPPRRVRERRLSRPG